MKRLWKVLTATWNAYQKNSGEVHAAAIGYYILVSMVPLLVLVISAAGIVLGSSEAAAQQIFLLLQQTVPTAGLEIAQALEKIIESQNVTQGIGFIGLIFSGSQMFLVLERALTQSWECPGRRWYQSRILSSALALGVGLFPLLSVILTVSGDAFNQFGRSLFDVDIAQFKLMIALLAYAVPVLLSWLAFTIVFKLLPNCYVYWRAAMLGALFTSLSFEVAKHLFSYYLTRFADLDKLYGSIASLFALVIWVRFASTVLLLGAEAARLLQLRYVGGAGTNVASTKAR